MTRYDQDRERPDGNGGYGGYYGGGSHYWEPGYHDRRQDPRSGGRYSGDFDAPRREDLPSRREDARPEAGTRHRRSPGRDGSFERGFDIGPAWGGGSDIGYRTYWRGGW